MLVAPLVINQAENTNNSKELINFKLTSFSPGSSVSSCTVMLLVLYQNVITKIKESKRTKEVFREKGSVAIKNHIRRVAPRRITKLGMIEIFCSIVLFFKATIVRVVPKTRDRFATFEPITFPIIIDPLLSSPAKKLVNISGADVPKAITVEPMKKGDIPEFLAAMTEYFSSFSALTQIKAMPRVIGSRVVRIMRQAINRLQV